MPDMPPANSDLDASFASAVCANEVQEVFDLVRNAPPQQREVWAFQWAAWQGNEAGVVLGMAACPDPHANGARALRWAVAQGHGGIVGLLLSSPNVPTPRDGADALGLAVAAGRLDLVERLVPFSEPGHANAASLRAAARHGKKEILVRLIPVSDPTENSSAALRDAAEHGCVEEVELLIPVSDVRQAWDYMKGQRHWKGLDVLAPRVPLDWVSELLSGTPQWIRANVPHAQALLDDHALRVNGAIAAAAHSDGGGASSCPRTTRVRL